MEQNIPKWSNGDAERVHPYQQHFPIIRPRTQENEAALPLPVDIERYQLQLEHHNFQGYRNQLQIMVLEQFARRSLPYGVWHCEDGREVLFNREYQPIRYRKDDQVGYANPDEIVLGITKAVMIWDDLDTPVPFLLKHLGYRPLDAKDSKRSKRALVRALIILREFTPSEKSHSSVPWARSLPFPY